MYREVFGKVYKTSDTPWINTTVIFKRAKGSFTSEAQYPPDTIKFYTDNLGYLVNFDSQGLAIPCRLWVNETGDKISNYQVFIGLDKFNVSVPVGDGSPISLSALRAGSQPTESYPQSILDYVDTAILQSGNNPKRKIAIQHVQLQNGLYILPYTGTKPLWQIQDDSGEFIFIDSVQQTSNSLIFDFSSYGNFTGTLYIILWD
jgi:hypothetical protein